MINSTLAAAAFNRAGLSALGPASPALSAQWSDGTLVYDESSLSMTAAEPSVWRAPLGGNLLWTRTSVPDLTDLSGDVLSGDIAVLRFHPQAVLRVQRLIAARYSTDGQTHDRPVPFCMAISGATPPAELTDVKAGKALPPDSVLSGDTLSSGTATFHDDRGLIIDPVAVACLLRDLMRGFPALRAAVGPTDNVTVDSPGSIASVVTFASGIQVHLVDLFGAPWQQAPDREGVTLGAGDLLSSGPHAWSDPLTVSTGSQSIRMARLPSGTLDQAVLSPPVLPSTAVPAGASAPVLERQFLRVAIVDQTLHLIGNRTDANINAVPGADELTQVQPAPEVASGRLEWLGSGQQSLGAINEISALTGTRLVVSPLISTQAVLPAGRLDAWPAVPGPRSDAEELSAEHALRARDAAVARYMAESADVTVVWPADALPAEAAVRLFPRVDPGPPIVPLAQLGIAMRGDGGSAVVAAGTPTTVVLPDPFRVRSGSRPDRPSLICDFLIVTRGSEGVKTRLLGSLQMAIEEDEASAITPPAHTNSLATISSDHMGVSSAPLLGLPQSVLPDATNPILATLGEAAPRESPRFATMARTESLVAGHDDASPGNWTGVLSAGIVDERSARANARLGNPGLPAGAEEHAPAVRLVGQLAQLVARAALRRTHYLPRRLVELNEERWNPLNTETTNVSGAVLQTVAPVVETPELRVVPDSVVNALPDTWSDLISALQAHLPTSLQGLSSTLPAPSAGDRWVGEVRRELTTVRDGRRDAQWVWRWVLSQARRLVYIETALFTATGTDSTDESVDLIALLQKRLEQAPDLRVVLVLPRHVPFSAAYASFCATPLQGPLRGV